METLQRCPACRARLGDAAVCSRCGTDFTLTRHAEAQALALTRAAVRHWARGELDLAAESAAQAQQLADAPLAQAIGQVLTSRPREPWPGLISLR